MADAAVDIERDPDEFEAITAVVESMLMEVHTAIPGMIEKWDAATPGVADVSAVIQRVYYGAGDDGEDLVVDQPVITNAPIAYPRGGGFVITWPLRKGDPVLLVFSQRSLDAYLETDGKTHHDSGDDRKHNISDAIIIPGLSTTKAPIPIAHATDLVLGLEDGSGELHIKPDGSFRLGTGAAAKGLAIGEKVDARLSALEEFAATHMHPSAAPGPPSPAILPDPFIPPVGETTASTRVFSDA
jgi:hypothetical protein